MFQDKYPPDRCVEFQTFSSRLVSALINTFIFSVEDFVASSGEVEDCDQLSTPRLALLYNMADSRC